MQSTLSVFRSDKLDPEQEANRHRNLLPQDESERKKSRRDNLLHHEPQVCAVGDHLLLFLSGGEGTVVENFQPTLQELLEKASEETGLFNQSMLVNSSGQDWCARNTDGKWVVPVCNELT